MLAERLTAQLLAGPPARDPVAVAERLLAIQGQDQTGARLAIRARTAGLSAADVDRALTADRSLLITWLNRGTLHLVRREDYPWLQALTTPPLLTGNARRLGQEGVSPEDAERGVAVIERSLAEDGPLTREQLRERVAAIGVPTERQALVHLLMLTSLRGLIVRGPMVGGRHAFVLVRDWLGEPAPVDRDRALAELARRYLAGHGPADARDLAKWAGLPLRDARAGLQTIASELEQREGGLVALAGSGGSGGPDSGGGRGSGRGGGEVAGHSSDRRRPPAKLPPPRLLGAFDPVLLGWTSREPLLGDHTGVVTVNGLFRPIALVDGRAVATWSMPKGKVVLDPFHQLAPADTAALEAEAADVVRFLGRAGPT